MNRYKFSEQNHIHTLDGKPLIGTSTATGVISKPLTWWAAETSAVECLEVGEKIPTIREEYLKACNSQNKRQAISELQKKYPIFKKARFAHFVDRNKKAEKGTDLHEELEKFVKAEMGIWNYEVKDLDERVLPFVAWAKDNVEKFLWSEAYCYSEELWVGGISDVGFIGKDGKLGVIDFKSSKEAYQSQFIQIAGYDIQILENGLFDKDGNRLLEPTEVNQYMVWAFGAEHPEPTMRFNLEELRQGFRSALCLHKLTKEVKKTIRL